MEVIDLSVPDDDGDRGHAPSLATWAGKEGVLVVVPGSVDVGGSRGGGGGSRQQQQQKQLEEAWRVWPHLSMEDPPRALGELVLVAYEVGKAGPTERGEREGAVTAEADEL